jgi:hypothetical protein
MSAWVQLRKKEKMLVVNLKGLGAKTKPQVVK